MAFKKNKIKNNLSEENWNHRILTYVNHHLSYQGIISTGRTSGGRPLDLTAPNHVNLSSWECLSVQAVR